MFLFSNQIVKLLIYLNVPIVNDYYNILYMNTINITHLFDVSIDAQFFYQMS